jgi:hypothetical protein
LFGNSACSNLCTGWFLSSTSISTHAASNAWSLSAEICKFHFLLCLKILMMFLTITLNPFNSTGKH